MSEIQRSTSGERSLLKLGAVLLAGGLTLAGCGGSSKAEADPSSGQAANSSEVSPGGVVTFPNTAANATLIFDDLGGGSSVIKVYPGFTSSSADKQFNGTFSAGDTAPAECETEGRTVYSDPTAGEADRTSDRWIKIQGTPGETQYATAVYARNPAKLLAELPDC